MLISFFESKNLIYKDANKKLLRIKEIDDREGEESGMEDLLNQI